MQYRVKCNCILLYGSCNKVSITLNVGQIWEYISKSTPSDFFQLHTLSRGNVSLEITNEDFEKIFEPQEGGDLEK